MTQKRWACECVDQINENLKPKNTRLSEVSMMNMTTGNVRQSLIIATERIERGKKYVKYGVPSFCPFCGTPVTPPLLPQKAKTAERR